MEQYLAIKRENPDHLLFYRMGEFYELFFEDAVTAARVLGIALTKRGKHLGEDIPLCGVPIRTADGYLQKLIASGFRVAVCDQTEDPAETRKRGSRAVVRREVIRLVTPGTLTEDSLLDARSANFLAALSRDRAGGERPFGIACIDLSTGVFRVTSAGPALLAAELARIAPREIVVPDALVADPVVAAAWAGTRIAVTPLPGAFFDPATAASRLAAAFDVATLDGFGAFSRAELAAASAALAYVEKTQIKARPSLSPPARDGAGSAMEIDPATRANLELTATLGGERKGSLLDAIDRTRTGGGSRLLAERIAAPSTDVALIGRRLDAVDFFLGSARLRRDVRDRLGAVPDIARALSRLALDRGGPRDLAAIRDGLGAAGSIAGLVGGAAPPGEVAEAITALRAVPPGVTGRLVFLLAADLPLFQRDGDFIRDGALPELDEARKLRSESRAVVAGLQGRYAEETGLRSLKVKHNNVLGYFIEVAQGSGDRLLAPPHSATFIHRQTMAGALRFGTDELADLQSRIAGAADRALALELAAFDEMRGLVLAAAETIRGAARALAELDVFAALAELAEAERYVRPTVDASLAFRIADGRHPVVEQALRAAGGAFVANDADLGPGAGGGAGRVWLVTGPNMAGKSTFLRQNALIAVLAQAGSHVPAGAAEIGVVDRLFSRVGAADDLARGRSTFMVEMVETAAILNQATERSLVILDEIGRGTATFDGLSIAWATIEHLHDQNRSRSLFATHFHELTALTQRLPRLHNATVAVKEWKGDVAFLHRIVPGAADRSYGVQVAKLAGLPRTVVARAREVLKQLEAAERRSPAAALIDDLPLFRTGPAEEPAGDALREELERLDLDALSPREALEMLYRLKSVAEG
ncbi:MAG: DNA mismatch repair protein MutS [Bauldia sp.]|nr:DNA mismatch repair protein MutS [Bauldia sp.]